MTSRLGSWFLGGLTSSVDTCPLRAWHVRHADDAWRKTRQELFQRLPTKRSAADDRVRRRGRFNYPPGCADGRTCGRSDGRRGGTAHRPSWLVDLRRAVKRGGADRARPEIENVQEESLSDCRTIGTRTVCATVARHHRPWKLSAVSDRSSHSTAAASLLSCVILLVDVVFLRSCWYHCYWKCATQDY